MWRDLRRSWLLVILAAFASNISAQQASSSPAETARAFLSAVEAGQWLVAAQLLDVEPIVRARQATMDWERRRPKEERSLTVEDILRTDPEMPRAVAEYQVTAAKRRFEGVGSMLSRQYADVADTTILMRLTPIELAARWLEAQDGRYQLRLAHLTSPSCRASPGVSTVDTPMLSRRPVVASVQVGDTAYVLYTDGTSERPRAHDLGSPPKVMELIRTARGWVVVPSHALARDAVGIFVMCEVKVDSQPRN